MSDSEVSRILSNLCSMRGYNATCDKKVAQELVSSSPVFCLGELREIRAKHIGVGVYRVTTEKWEG